MDKLNIFHCRGTEENIIVVGHHLRDHENFPISILDVPIELVPISNAMTATRYTREVKDPIQLPIACLQWPNMEQSSDARGRSSPSKRIKLSNLDYHNVEEEGASEYSSAHNAAMARLPEFTSIKDLVIFELKSNGLIGEICQSSTCSSIEEFGGDKSMLCKKCGKSGKALKMLICDLCEEAFHRPCSIPKKGKLPVDYWYCKACSQKNPGLVLDRKSINPKVSGVKAQKYSELLLSMLLDTEPYTTKVRIGKNFQAEVPIWPLSEDEHLPDSPEESIQMMDPTESDGLDTYKLPKSTIVGNWLQCHETIHSGDDGEGTICGKWRRAPFHATQTEDWDCSCALPWDPIHADCAVPQEVETEVALKQLKLLEKLKQSALHKRQKIG